MWLDVTDGKTTVRDLPLRDQIDIPVREQLIVELYSKENPPELDALAASE